MNNTLENRHEIVFWVEARNCNYNGDPDFDNSPRQIFETQHGFMTDVSLKRKVRDYVATAFGCKEGLDIFVKSGCNLNRNIAECVIEASGKEKVAKSKNTAEASFIAAKKFWDVRTFGGVMSTGLNAGQLQGAVQFDMPISYDEVQTQTATITRLAYADKDFTELSKYDEHDASLPDDKKRTIGKKAFANYALFECHAFVSANLAQKNGFTEDDLNILLESLMNMFSYQTSASKAGMSVVGPVVVFKHIGTNGDNNPEQNAREALLGCCSAQRLFKLLDVHKKDGVTYPQTYEDYDATIDIKNIPNGVIVGFKYSPFSDVIWGSVNDEWLKEL